MSETTPQESTYRIVRLEASNIKRLKAVEIIPNHSVVTLKGRNEQGKSSVLDAILWALAGSKAIPEQPIRRGASRAESTLDMGDFVCHLKITKSGASLTIKSKDGADIRQPATLLKEYTNEILIDPVSFLRKGENPEGRRKQAEKLRELVGLDFAPLDAEKEEAYNTRKTKNAELATAQGKLQNYKLEPGVPTEEVSVKELMGKLSEIEQQERETIARCDKNSDEALEMARAKNQENAKVKANFEACGREVAQTLSDLADIENQLTQLNNRKVALMAKADKLQQDQADHEKAVAKLAYEDIPALKKLGEETKAHQVSLFAQQAEPIRKQIAEADDTNTKIRNNKRYKELKAEVNRLQEESDALTRQIEGVDKKKEELLAAAKFPLEGLSFDESGILLDGIPLNQGSQAQQLKAALAIGFALKPKIRVALVRDASLLDEDSIKEIHAMMERWDAQAWLECVHSDDPTAIVIEDGAVKE